MGLVKTYGEISDKKVGIIFEAIEKMRFYKPIYEAILKRTKDRKQALDAIRFLISVSGEAHENQDQDANQHTN